MNILRIGGEREDLSAKALNSHLLRLLLLERFGFSIGLAQDKARFLDKLRCMMAILRKRIHPFLTVYDFLSEKRYTKCGGCREEQVVIMVLKRPKQPISYFVFCFAFAVTSRHPGTNYAMQPATAK